MYNTPDAPKLKKGYSLKPYNKPLGSPIYGIKKVFRPELFQGSQQKLQYFEGWYFKNASNDEKSVWSFIPGISLVKDDSHAFVQAINEQSGETFYFRFPADEFNFSSKSFAITIGNNFFSQNRIVLNLNDGNHSIAGELLFSDMSIFPVSLRRPGIMGWYRYVPFMECYHGVVSLDHRIVGKLAIKGDEVDFTDGRGYIEKDWGTSMPKAWIWMQTNHFDHPGTSFMLSVARIPWIGNTFTGFLGYFLYSDLVIPFATYTWAKIKKFEFGSNEVFITIRQRQLTFEIHATKSMQNIAKSGTGGLKAPVFGSMDRVIHESIDSQISLKVIHNKKGVIFFGKGRCSGFEMVGDLTLLKL